GRARLRAAVGAHRLVQPARAEGSGAPAGLLGLPEHGHVRLGRVPAPLPRAPRAAPAGARRVLRRARRAAAPRRRVPPPVTPPRPLPVPGSCRLLALAAARAGVAAAPLLPSRGHRALGAG